MTTQEKPQMVEIEKFRLDALREGVKKLEDERFRLRAALREAEVVVEHAIQVHECAFTKLKAPLIRMTS